MSGLCGGDGPSHLRPLAKTELVSLAPAGSPGSEGQRLRPHGALEHGLLEQQRLSIEQAETAATVHHPELAPPVVFTPEDVFTTLVPPPTAVRPLGSHPGNSDASPLPYGAA